MQLGDGVRIGPNCVLRNVQRRRRHRGARLLASRGRRRSARAAASARTRGCGPASTLADDVHIGNFVEVKASRLGDGSQGQPPHLHRRRRGRRATSTSAPAPSPATTTARTSTAPIIEDDCFIGSDATLVAPVRIARGSYIGAGSTISKDTPAGQLTVARARQVPSPAGSRRRRKRLSDVRHRRRRRAARHRPGPVEGLRRLEYRGYDSARRRGARTAASMQRVRTVGARRRARGAGSSAARRRRTGIAHTRWATHGAPTRAQRASASCRATRSRWCTTASSRTTKSCARELQSAGYRVRVPDRYRSDRAPRCH